MNNPFGFEGNYEKLEVIGDSLLDYMVNSNLIKFTLLGKFIKEERIKKMKEMVDKTEYFNPFDAHQAKSMLVKNSFLAKWICLFNIQKYVLYYDPSTMRRRIEGEVSDKKKTPSPPKLDLKGKKKRI